MLCLIWQSLVVPCLRQGGGIPGDQLERVFQYGFTTVQLDAADASVRPFQYSLMTLFLLATCTNLACNIMHAQQGLLCWPTTCQACPPARCPHLHSLLSRECPYSGLCAAQTSPQHGDLWSGMAQRQATPGGPWRMGGLGFGLPMSRLYARYFGAHAGLAAPPGAGHSLMATACVHAVVWL